MASTFFEWVSVLTPIFAVILGYILLKNFEIQKNKTDHRKLLMGKATEISNLYDSFVFSMIRNESIDINLYIIEFTSLFNNLNDLCYILLDDLESISVVIEIRHEFASSITEYYKHRTSQIEKKSNQSKCDKALRKLKLFIRNGEIKT